jgi:RNA recognition motif-containing protein
VRAYDPNRAFRDPGVNYTDQSYLNDYEASRLTVWVGNLPANITEAKLREHFETSGDVSHIQIVRRDMAFGKTRTFAFVTFTRADMPDIAVAQWVGSTPSAFSFCRLRLLLTYTFCSMAVLSSGLSCA